jgi:uroporphyrinogen III methyltransferase / synthase
VKVVVTRPRDQAGPLVGRLEALGLEVAVCPLIEIEPIGPEEIDVSGYDWLVVTSPNGARELTRRMRGRPKRIAVIGPGTEAALHQPPDLVPSLSTQEGLLAELPRPAGRVLFTGSEHARRLLVDELGADFVPLYRTKEIRPTEFPDADLVVLASASAARAYAALGRSIPAVSIGPQTTKAAREREVEVVSEAESQDLDGLAAAVTRACA